MTLSHLAIITGGYPSPDRPTDYTFVRELAHAVDRQGVRCTVIHPVAAHRTLKNNGFPYRSVDRLLGGEAVLVLRPRFFSLSARAGFTRLGKLNPGLLTLRNFTAAVRRTLRCHNLRPDALYGHFLYLAGAAAVRVGKALGVPAFPGLGESVATGEAIWSLKSYARETSLQFFADVSGLIVNSSLLKTLSAAQLNIPEDRIGMFPNGIDPARFHPRNKQEMRKEYGFPPDTILVGCIGHFSHRKGQQRILEAINDLKDVRAVFIGGGVPVCSDSIVFNASAPHNEVPEILSTCDLFLLPTLGEGSSNAIVEAMACGLPIISSRGAFNDDLLRDDMSIRVDPLNIEEIRQAILTLRDDPVLRRRMAEAALARSRLFDVNDRARRILAFMEARL